MKERIKKRKIKRKKVAETNKLLKTKSRKSRQKIKKLRQKCGIG